MQASTIRILNLLISLLLLMATIIVHTFFVRPAYREINGLRGDLAAKSELVRTQKRVIEEVSTLLGDYQSLRGSAQAVSLALPNKENYPDLVNQIQSLTRFSGLALQSLAVSLLPFQEKGGVRGRNLPAIGIIQLTLELRGPYQPLKNFLRSLESNIRLMDLVSLSINPGAASGDNYSYNMVVNTYYQSL